MWSVWIDRGGTFTDAIAHDPATGALRTAKLPSGPGSIVAAVHALFDGAPPPALELRLGTTLATNALLERRGARTALAITRGFGDLLAIGDQTRPALFALDIVRPAPLAERVLEVEGRAAADGAVLATDEPDPLFVRFSDAVAAGLTSLAVVVMNGHAAPALEDAIAAIGRRAGFAHVTCSHEVGVSAGLLARAETAVVDAYLTPVVAAELRALADALPGARLAIMTSAGGLVDAAAARGRDLVLSGPAGGAIATAAGTGRLAGATGPWDGARRAEAPARGAIGLDMGGTSTDVTAVVGALERTRELVVGGLRVRAPAIAIHTVAAGGGSIARFDGLALTVGPDSAGAVPGPICYGRGGRAVTVTDVDLILGRLAADHFPWPLDRAGAEAGLAEIARAVRGSLDTVGVTRAPRCAARLGGDAESAAVGLFAIANARMAEAVRAMTIERGLDARDFTLIGFGGAAGMHVCAIAAALGLTAIRVPAHAGLRSAWGLGQAARTWQAALDGAGAALTDDAVARADAALALRAAEGRATLPGAAIVERRTAELRYRGSDTAFTVALADVAAMTAAVAAAHQARFGFARTAPLELIAAHVELTAPSPPVATAPRPAGPTPPPLRTTRLWSAGAWYDAAPVYEAAALPAGASVDGPALVLEPHATTVVDAGWRAVMEPDGMLVLTATAPASAAVARASRHPDPVLLEIHGHRFMAIAEQMGAMLERTAVSVNIRERRDFSCAIFDAAGGLVANAPHVPVHLGAMGETVRSLLAEHPDPPPGTSFACNDPSAGGSHLPDITVVTPIRGADGAIAYVVANRGHHADVGGRTPGSMPPDSTTLADEGVVFRHLPIVEGGVFAEAAVRARLAAGPYPARMPDDNLADLRAQVAANVAGARLLADAIAAAPPGEVIAYLGHVQDHAAALCARAIAALPAGTYRFADALDDGAPISVAATVAGGRLRLDFTGSAPAQPGNLNAPRAVTVAAALYVVRALVDAPIPLNAGCLRAVDLVIPPGSILDPPPGAAVVAGNVETSQRVVDVLLGALGLAAASQGTMNNLTIGGADWAYYETIAGGAGASARADGASAVHTHMTNTRITDPELLEARFPVRLRRFAIRRGSGGAGHHRGGDGVIREVELLAPAQVAIVSQRRTRAPFGLAGGAPGAPGRNTVDGRVLPGSAHVTCPIGAVLIIETPGGGGFGPIEPGTPASG